RIVADDERVVADLGLREDDAQFHAAYLSAVQALCPPRWPAGAACGTATRGGLASVYPWARGFPSDGRRLSRGCPGGTTRWAARGPGPAPGPPRRPCRPRPRTGCPGCCRRVRPMVAPCWRGRQRRATSGVCPKVLRGGAAAAIVPPSRER